jgi:hypothetical protein
LDGCKCDQPDAIAHLLPQSEIAAETFAQYQLRDSRNIGGIELVWFQNFPKFKSEILPLPDVVACTKGGYRYEKSFIALAKLVTNNVLAARLEWPCLQGHSF